MTTKRTARFMRSCNLRRNSNVAKDERGEGVISLAIGVLIMAMLGAAMFVALQGTMNKAQQTVDNQVTQIGNGN